MKKLNMTLTLSALALGLTGCASIQQQTGMDDKTAGAVGGGALGCVGGALLAKLAGGNAAAGCAAGAVMGSLIGFEKARQEEIAAAESARQEALAAYAKSPQAKNVRASDIKTEEVTATDKQNQSKKLKAFESVSIDLPVASKGSPEYDNAMGKLKTLAERVADNRGSADIVVAMAAADARAQKMTEQSGSVQTPKGNTITVTKVIDNTVPKGTERITVKAGQLRTTNI